MDETHEYKVMIEDATLPPVQAVPPIIEQSPAQRSLQAGTEKVNSYQLNMCNPIAFARSFTDEQIKAAAWCAWNFVAHESGQGKQVGGLLGFAFGGVGGALATGSMPPGTFPREFTANVGMLILENERMLLIDFGVMPCGRVPAVQPVHIDAIEKAWAARQAAPAREIFPLSGMQVSFTNEVAFDFSTSNGARWVETYSMKGNADHPTAPDLVAVIRGTPKLPTQSELIAQISAVGGKSFDPRLLESVATDDVYMVGLLSLLQSSRHDVVVRFVECANETPEVFHMHITAWVLKRSKEGKFGQNLACLISGAVLLLVACGCALISTATGNRVFGGWAMILGLGGILVSMIGLFGFLEEKTIRWCKKRVRGR